MTGEIERPEPHRHSPEPVGRQDPWSIWFSRFIQVFGAVIMGYEAFAEHTDRPWLLLCAMAMLIGGIGLQLIVRWALGRGIGNLE